MSPRRPSIAVVVALVAVPLVVGLTLPAGVAGAASVVVTNATQTPSTPTAGDTFEVTATIRNQAGATGPFRINEVGIEVPGSGPSGYTRATDLGTLSPGTTMQVGLPVTIDDPGWHTVQIRVFGQTDTGRSINVRYPVTVHVVEQQRPRIDAAFEDGVAGDESAVTLTVANGLADSIRNLEVELGGDDLAVDRPRRVRSTLDGGAEANYTFDVTPARAGDRTLVARLSYTDASGEGRTATERFDYSVDPLDREVRLDVASVRGERPGVEVTVVNLGNAPLEDVSVGGVSGDASLSTGLIGRVDPQGERTVRLNVTNLAAADSAVTVDAQYETGGEAHEARRTVEGVFVPGRVDLTGIDAARTADGTVRITGTASNVGTTRVEAVTVRVRPAENVTPANPGKEYFVGAVDASDFASFTVNARVDGDNATTVPLEVSYLVDGEERIRTVAATYDPPETPDRGGSGVPLVGVGLVLVAVVVGAVLWRRRRAA